MAQSVANNSEGLEFSNAEEVHLLKKQGNFNNTRICKGKIPNVLANESRVQAVECLPKDGEVTPPAGGPNYNITVLIPRDHHTSDNDGSDQDDEISTSLEIKALRRHVRHLNITRTPKNEGDFVAVSNAGADTGLNFYS
jgi:hypothetical protein